MALLPQANHVLSNTDGRTRSDQVNDCTATAGRGLDKDTGAPRRARSGRVCGLVARLAVAALTVAGVALGLSSPPAANAMEVGTPITSGLSWRSGASDEDDFGRWRGRAMDVRVVFVQHDNWGQMLNQLRNPFFKGNCQQTPLCVVSVAMFPRDKAGQFRQCAAGAFDASHREIANLITAARQGAIIRLGWEGNSNGSHPWRIGTQSNVGPYKDCYRQLARIYRGAGLRMEWTVAKNGIVDAYSTYPGDDVVDFWGLHYYDSGKVGKTPTQEIGEWLSKARDHGKKMNVSEWGVWTRGDNADYIRDMNAFFRANAAYIGYENYYNKNSSHQLHPSTKFPDARKAYADLW